MKNRKSAACLTTFFLLLTVACGGPANSSDYSTSVNGLEIPVTITQMGEIAEIVVLGKVLALKHEQRDMIHLDDLPEEARVEGSILSVDYLFVTLGVDEYIRGQGPEEITLVIDPFAFHIHEGDDLVLFLKPYQAIEDQETYRLIARQGVFARSASGELQQVMTSTRISLDEFKELVQPAETSGT